MQSIRVMKSRAQERAANIEISETFLKEYQNPNWSANQSYPYARKMERTLERKLNGKMKRIF